MEVIDINNEEKEEKKEEVIEVKEKKESIFKKFKNYIITMPKKKKIIYGSIIGIVVIILVSTLVFFALKANDKTVVKEEPVILSMDNYKYVDGVLYFYDSEKTELGSYECTVKDETKCFLAKEKNDESLDNKIKIYSDKTNVESFVKIYGSLVFVQDDESLLLYDMSKKEVVGEYKSVIGTFENYAILSDLSDKYALVNLTDGYNAVTEFIYDYMGYIKGEDSFVYSKDGDYGIINASNESLVGKVSGKVTNYSDSFVVTSSNSLYSLYNYDNKNLISDASFIKLYEGYAFVIENNELYIYDKNFNKVNEEAIAISISDYKDYEVYSKKLVLEEKKYVVDYEFLNEYSLKVENKSFNLYEPLINQSIDYANYINGKWYFYSDLNKKDLIGSYTCTAKNDVTSATDKYTACKIASGTNIYSGDLTDKGLLPIVSNKYAFIYDTQSLALNDNIVLYDLLENKKLANYSSVDIIDFEKFENKLSFIEAGITVMAKNSKNELGMITINPDGAKGLVEFSYKNFKTLDEYYIFTTKDGYNYLYEKNGECLNKESKIKNEIIDFFDKYLVVNVNGEKQIYGVDGSIVSSAYKTIMFENDCYLGIDKNKKISVYKYNDPKTNYFKDEIDDTYEYLKFTQIDENTASVALYTKENLELSFHLINFGEV